MITFRDMTFCAAQCAAANCTRHADVERRDREELSALAFLPTAWADFSGICGNYQPITTAQSPEAE